MSLSTLLEAAQYLDYLDSNQNGSQQQMQPQQQQQQNNHLNRPSQVLQQQHQRSTQSSLQYQQTAHTKSPARRHRSSRKDAANTMLAMSLPISTNAIQMHQGVPIPLNSASDQNKYHQTTSLSSSFSTESPLSSFASTALCSKAFGVTSASSSAASSLSSSDSSSSCGEILMGDNDLTPPISNTTNGILSQSYPHQQSASTKRKFKFTDDNNQSFAHYIAATTAGPQLVTMSTTNSANSISSSAPIDGRIRARHVIQAATNSAGTSGAVVEQQPYFTIANPNNINRTDGQPSFDLGTSLGSDGYLSSSPSTYPPLIMARVQPMILNSISPSTHQSIMTYQQQSATASSPTSSSSSYSRHRELHKTLEKNRRAHLRHCFELLKSELPASDCVDKKTSHINIIKSAIRYVLALRQQECEMDNELQRLTKTKNELTERLAQVRNEQQHPLQTSPIAMHQYAITASASESSSSMSSIKIESTTNTRTIDKLVQNNSAQLQQPAAEQQLSFLLSQSKID